MTMKPNSACIGSLIGTVGWVAVAFWGTRSGTFHLDNHADWFAFLIITAFVAGSSYLFTYLLVTRHLKTLGRDIEIINTSYGRTAGWYVETELGERIAVLTDPQYADMFWVSYTVEPITPNAIALICRLDTPLRFRSRRFDEIPANAIVAGVHESEGLLNGRVHMRGLYLDPPNYFLAGICAWWLRDRE